jgi:hypothetical protein
MQRGVRYAALLAVAASCITTSVGIYGAPAVQAHQECIGHVVGGYQRGVACNRYGPYGDHYSGWVDGCDRHTDGYRVRAWADIEYPVGYQIGNWDPNGANSGCANDQWNRELIRHRICVEVVDCGLWDPH